MKILVVDDDPDILRLCATALRQQGHEITECNSGNEALAKALVGDFDLALCDLSLPDIHGLEIVRAIKLQARDLPVIVMSALDPREWRSKSASAGADHFLAKPLRLDVLRHEVHMAQLGRASLRVCVCDEDDGHRMRLVDAFARGGCSVRVVEAPMMMFGEDPLPDLVVLDASAPGAESVVKWAKASEVHCFVLLGKDARVDDDKLMRMGASLVVGKPVDPDALLTQARFLARQR